MGSESKDDEIARLKKKIEVQASLLSSLRLESSGLRRQKDIAEGKCEVACETARDFRERNMELKRQLLEVEAHLAMLLTNRDAEKDSHDAEVNLLQEELALKHNELVKQEKLFQKKIHTRSGTAEPAAEPGAKFAVDHSTEAVELTAEPLLGTETAANSERILVNSSSQTDSDLVLFPLRVAARKLHEDIYSAQESFRAAILQASDRWADG